MNDEDWKKYPVGSVGYYRSMMAYITPEHLRDNYKPPKIGGGKFKKPIRVKHTKLK